MLRLLSIEWKKIKGNTSFWVMGGIFLFVIPALVVILPASIPFVGDIIKPSSAKSCWNFTCGVAGFLSWTLLVFVLIFHVTNEYTYRTVRQNVIDGLTRADFFKGKLVLFAVMLLVVLVFVFTSGLLSSLYFGMGARGGLLNGVEDVLRFGFQTAAFFTFGLFVSFWIRKGFIAMLVYIGLFGAELLIYGLGRLNSSKIDITYYLPLSTFDRLFIYSKAQMPFVDTDPYWVTATVSLVYMAFFLGLTYTLFKKRDIS